MASSSAIGSLGWLFESGTVSGLGEAQLLEQFLDRGDEAAFEAILRRHGPMVLGVCRRVLHDPDDVDDAFQATFLVLVRRGRSIRDREALGTWLYGVSRRVAVRARVNARRRGDRERSDLDAVALAEDPGPRPDRLEARELRSAIDEELERLPSRYRAAVVLCDLEGQTHEQAAVMLGCPVGTVKSRLARGRDRLRSRLLRRGVGSPMLAVGAVPIELLKSTLGAAGRIATGGSVAAGAASLTEGVLRTMSLARFAIAAAAMTAAVLVPTGVRAIVAPATATAPPQAEAPPPAPPRQPAPADRGVERFRLANGMRVILRPIRGANETALVVVYDIGSDHDPEGRSGLAHAIEHLYVTSAGDEPSRTVEELRQRYPDGSNGQTGDRYTVIAASFPRRRLDRELSDASARMRGLKVTADDLDRERPRLIEEVTNMFERFAPLAALNVARERVRPMPAGGRHGGRPEDLRALTVAEIRARLDRYYKPRNAILALAGDLDPAEARRAIEARFATIPAGEPVPTPIEPGPPVCFLPAGLKASQEPSKRDEDVPAACLAYRAPAPDSDLYPAFLVLIGRLWAEGEQFGGVGVTGHPVYFTPIDDGSVVAISGLVRTGEAPAGAFGRIEKTLSKILAPKLDADEAAETKQQFGMFLGLADVPDEALAQNPYGAAFSLARRDQIGLDPVRINRALDALTDRDIKRAAATIFDPGRHAGAIAGFGDVRR